MRPGDIDFSPHSTTDPNWGEIDPGTLIPPPYKPGLSLPEMATEWAGDRFEDLGSAVRGLVSGPDYSINRSSDPAMHQELSDFFMTVEDSRRIQTDNIERFTHGLEDITPPANQATEATGGL